MIKNVISRLSTVIKEGKSKKIERYEEVLIDSFDEAMKEESFYELPTNEILKLIERNNIESIETIFEIISRMNKSKPNKSVLLLNIIKRKEATFGECIKILSKFEQCPICKRAFRLFKEDQNLPERDYEHEIIELRERTRFPSVTEKSSDFESDIFIASSEGKLTSVQYLLEQKCKAFVEMKDKYECTPISIASSNGYLNIVKYLYETCHADVETKDKHGKSPINLASHNGHLDVVMYLNETCHADVETKDKYGQTPINYASSKGHLSVVKYLYEICHTEVPESAINYASSNGHIEVVKYLYETCHTRVQGNAVNCASSNGHLNIVKYLYETCHADVETKDFYGNTPINNASTNGHLEVVKYLHETCHVKITEKMIKHSKTEEIKEYLCSKLQTA